MPVTPNLGLPYAQGIEFATDYPELVDEPRALLLDSLLAPQGVVGSIHGGSYPDGAPLWLGAIGSAVGDGTITLEPVAEGKLFFAKRGIYFASFEMYYAPIAAGSRVSITLFVRNAAGVEILQAESSCAYTPDGAAAGAVSFPIAEPGSYIEFMQGLSWASTAAAVGGTYRVHYQNIL
jgi:hypothetical protein